MIDRNWHGDNEDCCRNDQWVCKMCSLNTQHVNCTSPVGWGFCGLCRTWNMATQCSIIAFSLLIQVYILFIMSYRSYKNYWWDISVCIVSNAPNLFFLQRKREPRPRQWAGFTSCCMCWCTQAEPLQCLAAVAAVCTDLMRAKDWSNSCRSHTEQFSFHTQTCCLHWHVRAMPRTSAQVWVQPGTTCSPAYGSLIDLFILSCL